MAFITSLEIDDFIGLIFKAQEKREEARAWGMWLAKYPYMDQKTFVPFSEFFRVQRQPPIKARPAGDLLAEAERIRQAVKKKGGPRE